MEVQEDIGRSTITQNKILLWWTANITVLFLPHIEKLRRHDSIPLRLSRIRPTKNHYSRAHSKWMDPKAPHDTLRPHHCTEVAKIDRTQQF